MCTKVKSDTTDAADIDINEDEEHLATLTIPTKFIPMEFVPTKFAAPTDYGEVPKRVIDVSHLSEVNLKTLKKQDPFLYYSIPRAIRNSTADLTTRSIQEFAHSRRASCPSRIDVIFFDRSKKKELYFF